MRIKFLGTGSAFTLKNFQSNLAIEQNGKWLLLDAGGDIRFSLKNVGMSYKDVDAVYVSHLHADHAGGIETLAFCSFFDPKKDKIKLFGNGELLRKGWEDTWKGGLESYQGKLLSLNDYFDVNPVRPNTSFYWEGTQFDTVQAIHIMNGYSLVPSYGLMIKPEAKSTAVPEKRNIFWTSDTQFCPAQLLDFYRSADLIIQDCETSVFKSGVHASFTDLVTLPDEIKKKMILLHYQDNVIDDTGEVNKEWSDKETAAGFDLGFAVRGQEFNIDEMLK